MRRVCQRRTRHKNIKPTHTPMSERLKALTRLLSTPPMCGIPVVDSGGGVGAIVGGTGVQSNDISIVVERAGVTVSVPGVLISVGTGDCVDGVMHETGGGDDVGVQSGGVFAAGVAPRGVVPVPVPIIDVPVGSPAFPMMPNTQFLAVGPSRTHMGRERVARKWSTHVTCNGKLY